MEATTMKPGKEPVPAGAAPEGGDEFNIDDEPPNVSPEEQKQYDTVIVKAMELLYADDRLPVLLDKLKGGTKNISGEIGHSAAMVLTTIARTVESQGQEVPEDVLYAAGQEIVSQIVDIAVAAKLVDKAGEEQVAEAALYEGLRVWGQSMGERGKIDDQRQLEAQESMQQAGIQQDTSKLPGHGPAPEQSAGAPTGNQPPPPPPAGSPVGGLVNQAAGMQP